jgi:hypothetical protein
MNEQSNDYLISWRGLSYEEVLSRLNRMKGRIKRVSFNIDGYQAHTSTPTFSVKATLEEEKQ